jgi:hypothetical protein
MSAQMCLKAMDALIIVAAVRLETCRIGFRV